jgi:hypothetical protein
MHQPNGTRSSQPHSLQFIKPTCARFVNGSLAEHNVSDKRTEFTVQQHYKAQCGFTTKFSKRFI